MYRLYRKMTIYGHFSIYSIHFWDPCLNRVVSRTVLYPELCYNEPCYKEVNVYIDFPRFKSFLIQFTQKAAIFTPSIGTPYLLTIPVLKFEIVHSTTSFCVKNIAACIANSVDPDQMQHLIWVYSVCEGLSIPILRVITVQFVHLSILQYSH